MDMQKKRDFLTNIAYWGIVVAAVYLMLEYLLPVSVPFLIGILVAWAVVRLLERFRCKNALVRILLSLMIYGIAGLLIGLLAVRGVSVISDIVKWLPELYEYKLQPFVIRVYEWCIERIRMLDPALVSALEMVLESILSSLKTLVSSLSSWAVNLVSSVATGIPNLILSLLTMIFSTVFVVADYERITAFTAKYTPAGAKKILNNVRIYLTDTLFVVIRSYLLIMLLTFTELSVLFSLFGIKSAVLKAALIAVMDIMPILGTGGIMIPWAIISLVLGNLKLGIQLFIIYGIVTVVRNYVEPKIVGAQLGLHPIVTLVGMFLGLRLFGFWGLFGVPVGISFLWKQRTENN